MDNQLPELTKEEVQDIVEKYKEVYQNASSLESAFIRKGTSGSSSRVILSVWKQRNLERGTNTQILRTILCDEKFESGVDISTIDISNWALSATSKSEKFNAIIHCTREEKPKYYLEIWNGEKCLMVFDVAALEAHGSIYSDEIFGCLSWSPQEDKVAYIAEMSPPKTAPFYQQKPKTSSLDNKNDEPLVGEQYVYTDDWGEQMSPKSKSVIAVCNIIEKNISILNCLPHDICPGQMIWDPAGTGLVGIGINHEPRRLGIQFCSNRHICIFHLSLDGKYSVLSDETASVLSPRFSPDGKYLIWLQREARGPHCTNMALVRCEWSTKIITTLVDYVDTGINTKNGKRFYGIFTTRLPTRCWTSDSKYIIFNSVQSTRTSSYLVDVVDGSIWDISMDDSVSLSFLDVSEDGFAVFNVTSWKQPSTMVCINLASVVSGQTICNVLTNKLILEQNIACDFVVSDLKTKTKRCDATYIGPQSRERESVPVILFLHGGPHATIVSSFIPRFQFLAQLGFGIVIPHYRGSVGFGKAFVDALPGHVGSLDVQDCFEALQNAYTKFPWLDKSKAILFGGSHGGFLATHLSGQYPNDFIATVAANPVTNLPAKFFITDIPDWSVVENGLSYNGFVDVMTSELWKKMADCSPVRYVRNVKTPTLLLVGKKDLRVPPSQGLLYYNMLKELQVPTKVLWYDDNHSLSSIPVEMDSSINVVIWVKKCMKRKQH